MDNRLNNILNPRVVFIIIFLFAVLFWYTLFSFVGSDNSENATSDKLSGMSYYHGAVKDSYGVNPYAPYFMGFDNLTKYGYTSDNRRFVQDVITNFILYDLKQYHAKTSFVKDSFRQEASEGLDFHTSFKFGVNDSNIHTVNVKTNYITKDIVITIFDSLNKQVYSKSFSN